MIWRAPTSGNVYYRSDIELTGGELVEHGGGKWRVAGWSAYDNRGERPYYWYYVTEAG